MFRYWVASLLIPENPTSRVENGSMASSISLAFPIFSGTLKVHCNFSAGSTCTINSCMEERDSRIEFISNHGASVHKITKFNAIGLGVRLRSSLIYFACIGVALLDLPYRKQKVVSLRRDKSRRSNSNAGKIDQNLHEGLSVIITDAWYTCTSREMK